MSSIAPGAFASGLNVPGTVLTLPSSWVVRQQLDQQVGEAVAVGQPLLVAPVGLIDRFLDPAAMEGAVGEAVDGEDVAVARREQRLQLSMAVGLGERRGRRREPGPTPNGRSGATCRRTRAGVRRARRAPRPALAGVDVGAIGEMAEIGLVQLMGTARAPSASCDRRQHARLVDRMHLDAGPDVLEQGHRQVAAEMLPKLAQALEDGKAAVGPPDLERGMPQTKAQVLEQGADPSDPRRRPASQRAPSSGRRAPCRSPPRRGARDDWSGSPACAPTSGRSPAAARCRSRTDRRRGRSGACSSAQRRIICASAGRSKVIRSSALLSSQAKNAPSRISATFTASAMPAILSRSDRRVSRSRSFRTANGGANVPTKFLTPR